MTTLYRQVALSDHWGARWARRIYRGINTFSIPAPRVLAVPLLNFVLLFRSVYYFIARVFFCEPLFKAYCKQYGRNVRTGVFLHWVQGCGDIILGDDVTVDGKCSFFFAVRYCTNPTLRIGDGCGIGHNCSFTVGRQITIGQHCRIGSDVQMFDSPGHPADPEARLAGLPAPDEEVRPIEIGDNVWIGSRAIICPGVTIGSGSVVAMGAVVMSSVGPNTVVAGNPARQIRSLVQPMQKAPVT